MDAAATNKIIQVLEAIWCGHFKLIRDPCDLCPECLKDGHLVYMTPKTSKLIGRNSYRITYQCEDCGYASQRLDYIDRD